MLSLPARRNSLCLFCASAARSSQPQRLLPRTQVAHRVTSKRKPKLSTLDRLRPNASFEVSDRPHEVSGRPHEVSYRPREVSDHPRPNASSEVFPRKFVNRSANRSANRITNNSDDLLPRTLGIVRRKLRKPGNLATLKLTTGEFDDAYSSFVQAFKKDIREEPSHFPVHPKSLESRLTYLFQDYVISARFTPAEKENQKKVANLKYPAEWYPATREIQRTVHMHVGPTNSGKTYHALKRLEEVDSGIYLGPLRLLAHEVYTRLNAKGKPCALVTGEEQRMPEGTRTQMYSCTVEMAPLNTLFDVAVIDEIQMISHEERGWAWTQAFLGLQAREIHLCGEARTVSIMRELCALVGDKVVVHEYKRLTPLQPMPHSLRGNLNQLEKGDCVVSFSVLGIHALRRDIEKRTRKKCAIIYGSLPPETRAQQARLFNDPDNEYDYLVASDAIGMGLNLAIKRVIFETTVKNNGEELVHLQISEIKQIAGRAGRYKTAHQAITKDSEKLSITDTAIDPVIGLDDKQPDSEKVVESEPQTIGWATTLSGHDLAVLKEGMASEPPEITSAGLFPPSLIIERFANYFPPGTPFSYIIQRLQSISEVHPRFHLCSLKEQVAISSNIQLVENLSVQDRLMLCAAPISMRKPPEAKFLQELASCIASGTSGSILDLKTLPLYVMDKPYSGDREYLRDLEELHKMIVCYLWLSYRFPNVFTTRSLANYTKKLVEDKIEDALTKFSFTEQARRRIEQARQEAMKKMKVPTDVDGEAAEVPGSPEGPKVTANILYTPSKKNNAEMYLKSRPKGKRAELAA